MVSKSLNKEPTLPALVGGKKLGGYSTTMTRFDLLVKEECVSYHDAFQRLHKHYVQPVDTSVKRLKTAKQLIQLVNVRIGTCLDGDGVKSVLDVKCEYHETQDSDFVMVFSTIGVKLFKFILPHNTPDRLKELLRIVHYKFFEWEIRETQSVSRRGAKRGRGRTNLSLAARRYREIVFKGVTLTVFDNDQWVLKFDLFLSYTPQAINKFSTETNHALDLLFSHHSLQVHAVPVSSFIQKDFIDQIVEHSTVRLSQIHDPLIVSIDGLNVKLLPFQSKSLQWMLSKELTVLNKDQSPLEFLNGYVSFGYEEISQTMFWNKFTNFIISENDLWPIRENLIENKEGGIVGAQGLLSEEMGLGKTIEILSLILINKRQLDPQLTNTFIADDGKTIHKTNTSLIICPNAILQQWMDEVECHTCNNLNIFHYKGYLHVKKFFKTENITEIVRLLSTFDIIITSYNVVSTEVHYAEYNASSRPRRTISPIKYDYSSPLSLMQFFRIILDEVQMLQSDSTNAAKCTSLLHRIHTWGVSGTPIQFIRDYQTVLSYLKISPFHELPQIITALNANVIHKRDQSVGGIDFSVQDLMKFFIKRDLCIRHSKKDVISQIKIPKQHNYIVPLDFAPVEWDNYMDLWTQFISISGYDQNGDGNPRLSSTQLNSWLTRLRYLCCHAIFPDSNNKTNQLNLNPNSTALHNIDEVLRLMTADAIEKLDSLHRDNYQILIKSAQAKMELQNKPTEAVTILHSIKDNILSDLKEKYNVFDPFDVSATLKDKTPTPTVLAVGSAESVENEISVKLKTRAYLDLLHQCYFYIATGHFLMGSSKLEKVDDENEKLLLIDPKSKKKAYTDIYSVEEMETIEKNQLKEQEYYSYAEKMREQILYTRVDKVSITIRDVQSYFNDQETHPSSLNRIQFDDKNDYSSNMIAARCFKQLKALIGSLNEQADQFNELSEELRGLLYKPILKEYTEDNEDEKAQEYSSSIEDQDQMFALFACLEHLLNNRDVISQSEEKEKDNRKKLTSKAGQKISEYNLELLSKLKLITGTPMRPIFDELKNSKIVRTLSSNSRSADNQENFEDYLLQFEKESSRIFEENKRIRESLRKLNTIYNAKLEYYSHLQRISDSLVSLLQLENSSRNNILKAAKDASLKRNLEKISMAESRVKYLSSLEKLKTSIANHQNFSCPICLGKINVGSMIKCGHFFCRKCIHSWLKHHNSCPICKTYASLMGVYNFKFSNEEVDDEKVVETSDKETEEKTISRVITRNSTQNPDSVFHERYAVFPELSEVHKMTIKESFGAKIDFVIKLILFFKLKAETENDKEPLQFVMYSQSSDFLKVISKVLHMHEIRSLSCLTNSATVGETILRFKKHADITCLLLNVKALGAGLTLLNARHIFLLDAIINRGDELQAMGRNNRIGQTHETYVWNFMMKNSVEENIFRYKCILEGRRKVKEESQNWPREDIEDFAGEEEREEFEMNESTGEEVSERHLWNCFFQNTRD